MDTKEYFERIEEATDKAYDIAEEARSQSKDPEQKTDIPVATDLPEKASSLVIAAQFPELEDSGVADRIRELEDEYGKNDERVAFSIAREIAQGDFHEFDEKERACDAGVRVGVSYMTGGITTAPLEGIGDVRIRENDDGTEYLAVYYSGPIRSAGGTASAMSVLLADYVRIGVDLDPFNPSETVVKRYVAEVEDYYNRVTAKQYNPTREETEMIAENVPVEVTGSPTEQLDVSNYKDLEQIDTNRIRGGMCLVYLDGLPLKAPKIEKRIEKWGSDFGLEHWDWVEDYLELQKSIHSSGDDSDDDEEDAKYTASGKYLGSLTAGRPIFGHPGKKGGFRLRYGHSRTNGLAAVSFHPATMEITERFIAVGTQLKIEYPGKATVGTPCDTIHPPVVRLKNGDVVKVETREKAKEIERQVEEILFLGDMLVTYGEFVENGKKLLPSPYVEEWWEKELEKQLEEQGVKLGRDFSERTPSPEEAFKISEKLGIPLHPKWTYHWDETTPERFKALLKSVRDGQLSGDKTKKALEDILLQHKQEDGEIKVPENDLKVLNRLLSGDQDPEIDSSDEIPEFIENISGIEVRDQAPHYLGSRMGRPEKAEKRTIKGDPQLLFPCGKEEGGRMRNLTAAYNNKLHDERGTVKTGILHNKCTECGDYTYFSYCIDCNAPAEEVWFCKECDREYSENKEECDNCGNNRVERHKWAEIDTREIIDNAMDNLDMRHLPELLKSVRGMSGKHKHVEPVEKGLLRSKHDLYVNKDGTVRYDASDIPMTHFKPSEISVSVERLRELGYTEDVNGEPLEGEEQVLALKPQDIVVPDGDKSMPASDYFVRVAKFIDDLLEDFYGLEPYYDAESKEDLVGSLVIGLAPHTSGGTVGRIIGFTEAKGIYAHPYWHAAKRRNCFHPDTEIICNYGGEWREISIKELVEQEMENPVADDFGNLVEQNIDDLKVKSINSQGEVVEKEVEAVSKHQETNLIKFNSSSGEEIKVTPDHKMQYYSNGEIKKKPAKTLEKGEKIPVINDGEVRETLVEKKEVVSDEIDHTYCLTVQDTNTVIANDIGTGQCDGDEDAILLLMDGLLNFSRDFLPNMTGAKTMDAPLILSTVLNPDEVDDEAWAIETVNEYPLSFYEETTEYKKPWDLDTEIEIGEDIVHSDNPYEHGYTHETATIEDGPTQSEYVTLDEMSEKTSAQLGLGEKLKAVNENQVAELLLNKHFIPDIKGNLRSFSSQKMRCVDCNTKFRRVPLTNQTIAPSGKATAECPECDGKVLLTISEGTIKKYMQPSKDIIEKYEISPYVRQQILILNKTLQSLFGKDNRQSGLKQFTG